MEKNLTACYRAWSIPDVCTVPCVPASMWKMRGDFSVGGARVCFRIPENPCSPRPAVAGRANPLPPVADFGMKEVRTKKKKHMTKDMNGMKKKRGRPALGVTRNFAASLFRNIKYFTLRKLYLCRKWMQKRLQKTTTTGITLPNFDFLA